MACDVSPVAMFVFLAINANIITVKIAIVITIIIMVIISMVIILIIMTIIIMAKLSKRTRLVLSFS